MRNSRRKRPPVVWRTAGFILICIGAWSCGVSRQEVELAERDALNTVLSLVHNGDLDVALVAEGVSVLGSLDGIDVRSAFLTLLEHPDEIVVLRAVEALGRHEGPGVVDALRGVFEKTENALVKVEVAAALERLNAESMAPWLAETLGNGQMAMVRSRAAAAFGQLENPTAVPALRRAFGEDPDPVVRSSAALALARLEDLQSLPVIADTLLETRQLSTSLVMVEALEEFGTAEAIEHLETVAKQTSWQHSLRIRCLEALGGLSERTIGVYLKEQLLEEGHPMNRLLAVDGLGWIQDSTAVELLRSAFFGPENQPLRLSAAWSLARLGHGFEISEELEDDLKSKHIPFRRRAAEILGIIADERRIPALRNAFSENRGFSVRLAVVQALGKIHSAGSVEALGWAFHQDGSLEIRESIIDALGQITLTEANEALNEILSENEEAVLQAAALRGLARSGDINQLKTLRTYIKNAEPGLRLEAARGILELARGEIQQG